MHLLPRFSARFALLLLLATASVSAADGWRTLFNGRDLSGWKANVYPDSWSVVDGAIRARATKESSHLFFVGDRSEGFEAFKDFELEVVARSEPNANSGVFIHTGYATQSAALRLAQGYEIQLNSTAREKRKTGSLYAVVDLDTSPVDESRWFTTLITVRGRRILVQLDGRTVVDYTEPENVVRPPERAGRKLNPAGGAIALQAHDPGSTFYFKSVRLRPLAPAGTAATAAPAGPAATTPTGRAALVTSTPGLVGFWTFGEPAGQPRVSTGTPQSHPLTEVGGPIPRVAGGPFSGYAAELDGQRYFKIPYAETGDLNIAGPAAQVSMFAVVRIVNLRQSRTIAGMWSEGKGRDDDTGTRQYALLMNMPTYGGNRQLVPHISSEGGVTRRADGSAFPWCADYAATRREVPEETWCTLGFTYDGKYIRAYIDGVLDARALDPVKDKRDDRYFTREGPDGRDRGMNPYYHGRGIFRYDPAKHAATKPGGGSDFTVGARYAVGKMLGEATIGRFGGLAVFNRALSDAEMQRLHEAAGIPALR